MRFAISYLSTATFDLSEEDVKELFKKTIITNNFKEITGLLLCSESNFFQLIEGEEEIVKNLYTHIEKDHRHKNIIKFIEKPVFIHANYGYTCGFITSNTKNNEATLQKYFQHVAVLDSSSRIGVTRVIESMVL